MPIVDVVQIGAREHYAVPLMVNRLGLLRYLHTDVYAGAGSSIHVAARALNRIVPKSTFKRVLERRAALPPSKVRANNAIGFVEQARLYRARSVYATTVAFHRFQNAIAESAFRAARPAPDVFIGFRGSDRLFDLARESSACILDQIDGALHEVAVVETEQAAHPDWLPQISEATRNARREPSWLSLERPRLLREWQLADVIVCNSDWTRTCLSRCGVDVKKVLVVPLAYEPHGPLAPRVRGFRRNRLIVAFLGTLTLRKGIHLLLEAARLASQDVEIIVRMAGTLDVRPAKLAEYSDIATYVGPISRGAVREFLDGADILALPSVSEGFGIVQLEAMASGLPVVSSDRTGNIVRDGVDGRVVPAKDVDALARAFIELARDPDALCRMGRAASERARHFTMDRVAPLWLDAIREGMRVSAGRTPRGGSSQEGRIS